MCCPCCSAAISIVNASKHCPGHVGQSRTLLSSSAVSWHISPFFLPSPPPDFFSPFFSGLRFMTSHLSGAPNGLPWLAEDNFLEWQEQVMAYLQRKQIVTYVAGCPRFLPPAPPP